jgi:hypothetical protein
MNNYPNGCKLTAYFHTFGFDPEIMDYLIRFEEFEYITFVRGRGIKLNYVVK